MIDIVPAYLFAAFPNKMLCNMSLNLSVTVWYNFNDVLYINIAMYASLT